MSKIVFFCIPAYGHTNPTIEVVRELTKRGHEVWYYSFSMFRKKIEGAGAKYIECDKYVPELKAEDEKKIGKDFAALIEMTVDTTIALDEKVCKELNEFHPDCIVSDSLCFWGKLFAAKLNIKYVCSTTSFAFNQYTAKMMKQNLMEMVRMIKGMHRIKKKIKQLNDYGYAVDNFISLIQNDNETYTIVYTSKEFQPLANTFSNKYFFVGPSVSDILAGPRNSDKKLIYISLGTVNNKNNEFYKKCLMAFGDGEFDVIMSVGESTDISSLGEIPENFEIKNKVEQIKVLQNTDVFITHSGMNSVNESLYYGVPMVLFPQHQEQRMVAERVVTLGAGVYLKNDSSKDMKEAVQTILEYDSYQENAVKLSESLKLSGGAKKAAEVIGRIAEE